jgi:hypothetical protein
MNRADDRHEFVSAWLDTTTDDLATTPLVVAEVDRLVTAHGGRVPLSALPADLAAGAYIVEWWPRAISSTGSRRTRW